MSEEALATSLTSRSKTDPASGTCLAHELFWTVQLGEAPPLTHRAHDHFASVPAQQTVRTMQVVNFRFTSRLFYFLECDFELVTEFCLSVAAA